MTNASFREMGNNDALNVAIVDASGNQITSFGGSSGGPITDGVSDSIKATVLDYANGNPIAVRLTDTNGDYVSASGGTQYTEDAASASDPVGTQLIARRRDSLSTETTANGDVTALNSTGKGELYVKHVDSIPVTDNGSSLTVDGAVTISVGTDLIGKISSGLDTAVIYSGTTGLTPKFAVISASSSGNTTVVAAVTSKKIRVLAYTFQADADVAVKFRDNSAGVDLTGAMSSGAKGGGSGASFSPVGHFETASGNALSINLASAVQVSGHLTYVEV